MNLYQKSLKYLPWKVNVFSVEKIANDANLAKINQKLQNEENAVIGTEAESNISWFIWRLQRPRQSVPNINYQSHGFSRLFLNFHEFSILVESKFKISI